MIKTQLTIQKPYDPYLQKAMPLTQQSLNPNLEKITGNIIPNNLTGPQLPNLGLSGTNPLASTQNNNQTTGAGKSQAAWTNAGGCGCGSKGCGAGGDNKTTGDQSNVGLNNPSANRIDQGINNNDTISRN